MKPLSSPHQTILEKALAIRTLEESLLQIFSKGLIGGTIHTCIGQELVGPIIGEFLNPNDAIFSNHRGHGHFIGTGGAPRSLIAEILGSRSGTSGGLGGTQHLFTKNFMSGGIQGGLIPLALGRAFAKKRSGSKAISVVFLGDGTLGEGIVYECFNWAAKWELPVLIVVEDNQYAQSTHRNQTLSGSVVARAEAFGIGARHTSTWEWSEFTSIAENEIENLRTTGKPILLHVETYRLRAHSKGDDHRGDEELKKYERLDPLNCLLNSAAPRDQWAKEFYSKSLHQTQLLIEEVLRDISQEPAVPLSPIQEPQTPAWEPFQLEDQSILRGVQKGLRGLLHKTKNSFVLGEDIESPYGGAFKSTQGLSRDFPDRVLNTPISEATLVGFSTGLALEGHLTVAEIMFGDFVGLAFDQILNHLAKIEFLSQGTCCPQVLIRTPMGGHRAYGPTHSQTLEKHFLGIPGLTIVALNSMIGPEFFFETFSSGKSGPLLVIENKKLYSEKLCHRPPVGWRLLKSKEAFPMLYLEPQSLSVDLTLLGYGGMSPMLIRLAESLFEEADLVCQVLCPTRISPFSIKGYLPILQKSSGIVFLEEGQLEGSWSSEVLAQLAELAPDLLINSKRIGPRPSSIPAAPSLEKIHLPEFDRIFEEIVYFAKGKNIL